jgi:hypothetical protein
MDWTEAHLQGDLEAMQQVREEAIVRAALEKVVSLCRAIADGCGNTEGSEAWAFDEAAHQISVLASNPAEVAAIIAKAGEDRG